MPNPLTRISGSPSSLIRPGSRRLPGRVERALRAEVDVVQAQAIAQAARTQAVEFVGESALRAAEQLTNMEVLALRRNPLGESRYKAITDTATAVLARIVAETE